MKLTPRLLFPFVLGIMMVAPMLCRAQAPAVSLPLAYLGQPYSQSIPETLRDRYQQSQTRSFDALKWRAIGPTPPGLGVDRESGMVFGTPLLARAQPFHFSVQALDESRKTTVAFVIVLRVERARATTLANEVKPTPPPPDVGSGTRYGDIEIPEFQPKRRLELPIVIKNATIRQLEVLVYDAQDKLISTASTPEDLKRGEVRTSVTIDLALGKNTIHVRDADSGKIYKWLVTTVHNDVQPERGDDQPEANPALQIRHSGFVSEKAENAEITIHVGDARIHKVKVIVWGKKDDEYTVQGPNIDVAIKNAPGDYPVSVKLAKGDNRIIVSDVADESGVLPARIDIKRKDPVNAEAAKENKLEIEFSPLVDSNTASTPLTIKVTDADIGKIKILVTIKPDKEGDNEKIVDQKVVSCTRADKECIELITLAENKDSKVRLVDVTNVEKPEAFGLSEFEKADPSIKRLIEIRRKEASDEGGLSGYSSINTRAIVGFEQTGASSTDSTSKPFLDFFFTAPLVFGEKSQLPRASIWGNVRLAALPQQVAAFGTFPSSFVNQVADAKLNSLVQGFDFNIGPEIRIHDSHRAISGLIPGVKQRVAVYLAGSFGAISPLQTNRDNVQIFSVPSDKSPQFDEFKRRFGEDATKRTYIALTLPERDRFLRQYYFGLRFKTHFFDGSGLMNRFPAIFDAMVGQNEAVSGGKLTGHVMKFEGFVPLPIKQTDFLYLYGTALMHFGDGGVKINKPLFLDTAPGSVSITSNDVFIFKGQQTNADYYRIGVGVDLMKLFAHKPSTGQ